MQMALLIVGILALWLAPIATGVYLAPRRGRRPLLGFACGFFFGWFGVLLLVLFTRAPRGNEGATSERTV